MNDIYLKHRYHRLRYLNLIYIGLLTCVEGYFVIRGTDSLIIGMWTTPIIIVGLLVIYGMSYIERFKHEYAIYLIIALGVTTVLIFATSYFVFTNHVVRYLAIIFLMVFLSAASSKRLYKKVSIMVLLGITVLLMFTPASLDERLLFTVLSISVLIQFFNKSRHDVKLHKDYYGLYSSQRRLIENVNEGFALHEVIWDEAHEDVVNYKFIDVNESFEVLTGLKAKEIIGNDVRSILPETEEYWIETYGNVVKHQMNYSFVNYTAQFDKYFKVSVYPVGQDQFATLFLDVTRSLKAEGELKEQIRMAQNANNFKSQFLKDVNHKLRTPLNGMMGMAQLIAMDELSQSTRELFDVMMAEMDHTRNIINQIAEYIELKDETYEITKNNVIEDIKAICQIYSNPDAVAIEIKIKEGQELEGLFYEHKVLERVLVTLIANGVKHSQSKKIVVDVKLSEVPDEESKKQFLDISVKDYGKGISEELQTMIFNQLHHEDFINIYREKGHMSLPLCKELMVHIGGDIQVRSSQDEGTEFMVRMPIFSQIGK